MGNGLFKDLEEYKRRTSTILWGINTLKQYHDTTVYKNYLELAEQQYRSCSISDHYRKKMSTENLMNIADLFEACNHQEQNLRTVKFYTAEKYLLRFLTLINIFLFHRNQKDNQEILQLSLLLRKNGLSSSGIHILQNLGLASSPKTFSKKLVCFKNQKRPQCNFNQIHWYDNLYRSLKGFFLMRGESSVCYTAHGVTEILDSEPIPVNTELLTTPAISKLFNATFITDTIDRLAETPEISDFPLLDASDFLTLPLRVPLSHPSKKKLIFRPESLLKTNPATPHGTIMILKHLKTIHLGLSSSVYCFMTVDYDIYWRLIRLFHSASFLRPSFPKCKESLVLILGPWHILFKLLGKIWRFLLPYLFSFLYFKIKGKKVSPSVPFVDQLHFLIALYKYRKSLLKKLLRGNITSPLNRFFTWLLSALIPTVCSSFFI